MSYPTTNPHLRVSLNDFKHNLYQLKNKLLPGTTICAVIKDNAYGCGAGPLASIMENEDFVSCYAVARYPEALYLRQAVNCKKPILILGRLTNEEISNCTLPGIILSINDVSDIDNYSPISNKVKFHCNIDSGMGRLGLLPSEIDDAISKLKQKSYLNIEGIFTHFANADNLENNRVSQQMRIFNDACDKFKNAGFLLNNIHFNNSAAFLYTNEHQSYSMIRPGISLYGSYPDATLPHVVDLRPIVTLVGSVIKIKDVPQSTPISYGSTFITKKASKIATVNLGYAHGVPRYLANKGNILIHGTRFKIVGRVTMDYIMVDLEENTDIIVGDEAVVLGYQGNECIRPDEIASHGNTISYEVLCNLGRSLDRLYFLDNILVNTQKSYCY